jgi:1-acyl-sn-glycerol-3-phosphate acyltransferase
MNSSSPGGDLSAADLERFHAALRMIPARQGFAEGVFRRFIRLWCWVCAWRVDVRYVADLPVANGTPGSGCLVVAAPHRAWLEPFLLVAAWPASAARLVWLADGRTVGRSRWRRWLLPRLGVIPIHGGVGSPRLYVDLAREALAAGHALAIFPEVGPPSVPDRARSLSPGFAYVALGVGAPVVPVVVGGTHHIVRGSTFSIDVLSAIETGPAVADPFTPSARERAHDLASDVQSVVADVLPERTEQADRRRPSRDRWRWLATLLG